MEHCCLRRRILVHRSCDCLNCDTMPHKARHLGVSELIYCFSLSDTIKVGIPYQVFQQSGHSLSLRIVQKLSCKCNVPDAKCRLHKFISLPVHILGCPFLIAIMVFPQSPCFFNTSLKIVLNEGTIYR